MKKVYSTTFAGRTLTVETGELAQLANASALVRYGDTVVLSTATASAKPKENIDFFPLSVDYEEKLYAVGRIPGGFIRREGRPSEKAILTGRVIDRSIRPLFDKDLRNDVVVINTLMSVDQDNSPEIAAMLGASIALSISDIPFAGPIGGVAIGLVDGEVIINPNEEQREVSKMYVTLAAKKDKIMMIEAAGQEIPDDIMLDAIKKGHEEIIKVIEFIDGIVAEIGKEKIVPQSVSIPEEFLSQVKEFGYEEMREAVLAIDKKDRDDKIAVLTQKALDEFSVKYKDSDTIPENKISGFVNEGIYKLEKKVVREYLIKEQKRVDGRDIGTIRPLSAEVGILPRVHGSGLFARGQTQVLTICTLGASRDEQMLDGIDAEDSKRFMHHYNFPAYSVGEARTSRGPGRREIGHGALAEKALEPVLPDAADFPYTIRLVSEVLMSNGSTSQGSVCASTLALMDAGVPIKRPVAGISCGLVTNEEDENDFITFMDIQGIEDFFGDMDFKVAGTTEGITAIQMDMKVKGLSYEIIRQAFEITKRGRLQIIEETILPTIPEPRADLSQYAPRIISMKIDVDKIREVIGSGGKVINKIISDTGVKIDIEEDGSIFIVTADAAAGERAKAIIEGIVKEPEIGEIYEGTVKKIMDFGAFVEILPGKEGLVHISKLDSKRVEKVEDVVSEGDVIKVKLIEIDSQGRLKLSRKDAM